MNANGPVRAVARATGGLRPVDASLFDGPIAGSGLAIVAVAAALAGTYLTWPMLRPTPWALFYLAVMASAWFGGLRPALLATALAAALGPISFVEPSGAGAVATLVFAGVSGFIGYLMAARRRSGTRERVVATLEGLTDGFWQVDRDWRLVYANGEACRSVGLDRSDLIGRTVWEAFPALAGTEVEIQCRRAAAERVTVELENFYEPLGRWFGVEAFPTEGGGLAVLTRDITERKQAERVLVRERELLQTIIDRIPVMITVYDPDTRLLRLNPEFERVTGWSTGDAAGVSLMEECYPHPEYRERVGEFMRSCRDGWMDIRMRTRDGRDAETSWANIRLSDGTQVGIGIDITERKRAEAALRDADRRKDQFLATLAHELRNPLSPIRSAVQVLKAKDWPDPDLIWGRDVIGRQAGQMARLLDDLLDVSRIARGKLELRRSRVELASLVESAIETSRPLIQDGGHELTVALPDEPVYLDADPVRLAQVFSNLLNNAAKYTERGGRIRLAAERRGGEVTVTVKDTGIGLAAEMMPHLFEMFSQATQARERSQGGLGIGLSLVKGLVEIHGGTIEARSDGPGHGSEFTVRLPVAAAPSPPDRRPSGAEESCASGCKIIVADDNRDAAVSLARLLEVMGNEVRTAGDGQEAVAVAEAFRPDVVLLDIGMPRLNGYEAARRIREQPWGRDMILVALTGWGQEEDKRRSQEAGFDVHMTKPVDPQTLQQFLESVDPRERG